VLLLLVIEFMEGLIHAVGESLELLELINDILRSHYID
jgi:hypothetical protein